MGSKYQQNVKIKVKQTSYGTRKIPKYYDEKIISAKKKSNVSAYFIIGLIIVGFGIFGIGKLIENAINPSQIGDSNENSNYTPDNGIDISEEDGYLTPLIIKDINGIEHDLSLYKDKAVILYFHFLTCSACHTHSPNLANAIRKYSSDQLLVLSISVSPSDTISALKTWKSDNNYQWYLVQDSDYSLSSTFNAQYTPHTIYLDGNGEASYYTGAQSQEDIKNFIEEII